MPETFARQRVTGITPFVSLWLACCLMGAGTALGGVCNSNANQGLRHNFEFTAGYSPDSASLIGTAADRRFVMAGFQYSYTCWVWKRVSASYTAGMMPAAIVLQPATSVPEHSVYGFGMFPLGFTAEFAKERKLHPYAEFSGGAIASIEPVPVNAPNATGLNFAVYLGGGVRWNATQRTALDFGYRFLHMSNGGTTSFNPGLDNNVFYIGYALKR